VIVGSLPGRGRSSRAAAGHRPVLARHGAAPSDGGPQAFGPPRKTKDFPDTPAASALAIPGSPAQFSTAKELPRSPSLHHSLPIRPLAALFSPTANEESANNPSVPPIQHPPGSRASRNRSSSSFGGVIFSAVTTERLMRYLRMPHRFNNQAALSEPVSRKGDNGFGKPINFFDMRPPQNLAVAKSVRDRFCRRVRPFDQSSFGGIP
jgi:hypothetical protein